MSEAVVLDKPAAAINPFGKATPLGAAAETDRQRAVAEVLAALEVAQRFPRDQQRSMDRILNSCSRASLAEKALYAYSRGGTNITGPSIRLAETIAQNWGNLEFGWREVERRKGESLVEAWAWDVETNTRARRAFQVAHVRDTRSGSKPVTDGRDIYELLANEAARRMRASILALIPPDVVDEAVKQVNTTLTASVKITPKFIEEIVTAFGAIGVPKDALEKNIQRRMESITPALVLRLKAIKNSITDGMSKPADWFEIAPESDGARVVEMREKLKVEPQPTAGDGATQPPLVETPEGADLDEIARITAMTGPDVTKYIKAEARRLKVGDEELEDIVNDAGGWAKRNAAKILETMRRGPAPDHAAE